jgi:pyruvate formate lyase activating enzyme
VQGEQAVREALWFLRRPEGGVACLLCPHHCVIAEGRHGVCGVRFCRDGGMELPYYGKVTALAVDPVEKKPLYHFHPGARILSVGFLGCSMRCKFCQNYHISQGTGSDTRPLSPHELVAAARKERSFGVAYTYSEPLVHFEYVMDSARLVREAGLKNVLVSNGYLDPGPAEEVLGLMDAANIDLKGFDPDFYRSETGGDLEEVKRFLTQAAARTHLEVTTLVIPGRNDDPAQVEAIAKFVASLGPNIPLHLSAYYPMYRYEIPPTPPATIRKLAAVARQHLRYVYMGNIGPEETNTLCPGCGHVLIQRVGYNVKVTGIEDGACAECGAAVPIVMG